MTDEATAAERAERIRRLQERGAGSARPRRRHPAAATRIMLAGLSVASFLGIAGSVALVNGAAQSASPAPVAATPAAAAPPANAAVASSPVAAIPIQAATPAASATPAKATATVAPHAKTRGS